MPATLTREGGSARAALPRCGQRPCGTMTPMDLASPGVTPEHRAELRRLAVEITLRLGYVDVHAVTPGTVLPHRCAQIVAAQIAGEDPTASWRAQVGRNQEQYYGAPAPPQVGAAFVLQWYLGVVAQPLASAAILSSWVLDGSPEALSFDLAEPDLFPVAIGVDVTRAREVVDPAERVQAAHAAYLAHARPFADSYRPPEVRMGSGQRGGLVHDAWTMALETARGWLAPPGAGPVRTRRRGCCMIYALPGARECAGCPRGVRTS